jgi:hypothetical protein
MRTRQRFSLVLLNDGSGSLLDSLSTAFARASLWRPGWVGAWTFWGLTVALVATFGLAVIAIADGARADGDPAALRCGARGSHPDAPAAGDDLETRKDLPQPIS